MSGMTRTVHPLDRPLADLLGSDLPGLGRHPSAVMQRIELAERLLERAFVIPGINRPVGADALLGLIPVAGDVLAAVMGLWLVWEARNLGLPRWKRARMIGNIAFDTALGAVPLVGDVFDFMFRSNSRNLAIIRKHVARHHPELMTVAR